MDRELSTKEDQRNSQIYVATRSDYEGASFWRRRPRRKTCAGCALRDDAQAAKCILRFEKCIFVARNEFSQVEFANVCKLNF